MTVGTSRRLAAPSPELPAEPDRPRAAPGIERLLVAVAVGAFLLLCWRLRGFVTDDSWISVRYAENLARGHGAVWNPGGERVEGFSNPALVYVEALADLAGWSALGAARTLGILSGVACLVLAYAHGRHAVGATAAAVGAVLAGLSAPFALWAVGGLETLPVALVLTVATVELARPGGGRAWLAGPLLALLPWLRPEGLVVALAVVAASEAPGLLRRATSRTTVRRLAWLAAVPVISQAALELVRLGVYGHLLPNSVLYKSGTGELLLVLEKFLAQSAIVVVLALTGAALAGWRARLLLVPFAVYALGSLGTLDSANVFSRFFLPVWPQLALLAGVTVATLVGDRRRAAAVVLTAASSLATLLFVTGNEEQVGDWQARYMTCRAGARADMARWLVASTPPSTTFSVSDAGLLPARAGERTAIDAFFLNEPVLQETGPLPDHDRAERIAARRPDVVVLASRVADRLDPVYPTDAEIAARPEMAAYDLAHVASGRPTCTYHLLAYRR